MINGGLSEEEVMVSFEETEEIHQAQENARVRGSQELVEEVEDGEEAVSEYRPGNRVYSDSGSGSSWLDILAGRGEEIQSRPRAEVLNEQEAGLSDQTNGRLPGQGQDNVSEWNLNIENLQPGWVEDSDEEEAQTECEREFEEEEEESGSGNSCILAINMWDSSDEEENVWGEEGSEEKDPEEEDPEEEDLEEEDPEEEKGREEGKGVMGMTRSGRYYAGNNSEELEKRRGKGLAREKDQEEEDLVLK